jgi:hypothetical protein
MVSGNAMAHIYLDVRSREKPRWPTLGNRWRELIDRLLERPSIDLMILPTGSGAVIRSTRGDAEIVVDRNGIRYIRSSGDPLGIGKDVSGLCDHAAYEATADSDYPDSLTQIARIASSGRSGEVILSAARGWDFRAKYEPIPHVSSHGALHREHMMVPLLMNKRYAGTPRRTTDVMPSALSALGRTIPAGLDGASFI